MTVPESFGFRIGTYQQHAGDEQPTTHGLTLSLSRIKIEDFGAERKKVLEGGRTARMEDCRIARVEDCRIARVEDCRTARVEERKIVGLDEDGAKGLAPFMRSRTSDFAAEACRLGSYVGQVEH